MILMRQASMKGEKVELRGVVEAHLLSRHQLYIYSSKNTESSNTEKN